MFKKFLPILAVALLALILIPAAAFAQTTSGKGTLTASGNGTAVMQGNGTVKVSGKGLLTIIDQSGDASVSVTGTGEKKQKGPVTIYQSFDGAATVTGSNIRVVLRGENVKLEAAGKGFVALRGKGTYEFNGTSGIWSDKGVNILLGE